MCRTIWKGCIDLIIALPVFIISLKIITFAENLIFSQDNEKPFFTQLLPRLHEHLYLLFNLPTMHNKRDIFVNLLSDSKRLTFLGNIALKLPRNELTQLINVFKGDMSLISTRPWIVQDLLI